MKRVCWSSLLLAHLLCAAALTAQAPDVMVETRVNLRRDPSTTRRPIRVLRALERLTVVGPDSVVDGFLRVRTRRGEEGWVSLDYTFPADETADRSVAPSRARSAGAP